MGYIISMDVEQIKNIGNYENLLFNLMAGLLPEYLSQDEVEVLKERHGENWFEDLGYNETDYKKPLFE